jgi:GntR family transcriptional regulator of gluconate operon
LEGHGDALEATPALRRSLDHLPHDGKLGRSLYSGAILDALRDAVIGGEIRKGTHLVESRLAAEFRVSRGPVRSALQALVAEGLAQNLRNGRTTVVGFGADDVASLFRVRHVLESTAVRWGVEKRADTRPIQRACEAFEDVGNVDERQVKVDVAFHRAVIEFGQSRFLRQAWLSLAPVLQAVMKIALEAASGEFAGRSRAYVISQHKPVADAICEYDAERAISLLERQFEDAEARLGRYYASRAQAAAAEAAR